ncbi:MAG: putative ribonuclease III [Parcubacteria group bacterium Gr01-1014_48]|nr:MAG: putative ribonuclease III [Parcubacteria group bacterium Greene0416_14]TSC73377.1 MAG: putative ribonuclease III [Parcubacteria group bacterium Gr01-1014_48]TSD01525.1 MAG: putative ribonuclease III [Parcubacteria group bacterium Greene1014_15]TSD08032.1 MAG: putative ribonuclease III [Parcubacteria group bacterium Greene0714_4]
MADFNEFEEQNAVVFKNKALLRQAFTHRSYINENKSAGLGHNERLEFLGDAVLELVVTEYLYGIYPDKTEGELTSFRSALVNTNTISRVAGNLYMDDYLLLSRGEAKDTGRARQYILANTFEAVIGAIYLDQGYAIAQSFIEKNLFPLQKEMVEMGLWQDSKSLFQEKAQDIASVTPTYKTVKETGPDHDKYFTVAVYLGSEMIAEGKGRSKQEAEQEAARHALEEKRWN